MTAIFLLDELKDFIENVVKNYLLETNKKDLKSHRRLLPDIFRQKRQHLIRIILL